MPQPPHGRPWLCLPPMGWAIRLQPGSQERLQIPVLGAWVEDAAPSRWRWFWLTYC